MSNKLEITKLAKAWFAADSDIMSIEIVIDRVSASGLREESNFSAHRFSFEPFANINQED